MTETLRVERRPDGVAAVVLARPARHNAFDEALLEELTAALGEIARDPAIDAVVLAAEGRSFCAGGDLDWIRRSTGYDREQNIREARAIGRLMQILDGLPVTTIAKVQGPALGAGVGLIACRDIAIAAELATFALSETKLGLVPAAIGPYVLAAIGARNARRYFQTAETFDARAAHRIGLIYEVTPAERLNDRVDQLLAALAKAAPNARRYAKDFIARMSDAKPGETLDAIATEVADIRATDEANEGLTAFLERRAAAWATKRFRE